MHKKLESELIHLAHQILKLDNTTDINVLRNKARDIYDNLSVLSFIDNYFVDTPSVTGDKDEFLQEVATLLDKKQQENKDTKQVAVITPEPITPAQVVKESSSLQTESKIETPIIEKIVEEKLAAKKEVTIPEKVTEKIIEEVVEDVVEEKVVQKTEIEIKEFEQKETDQLIKQTLSTIKTEAKEIATKIQKEPTPEPKVEKLNMMDEEMKHSIPADVAANMFKKIETKVETNTFLGANLTPKVKKEPEIPKVNIATKREEPISKPASSTPNTSLNDRIFNTKIQVGLNDRIAFVKHLFSFSQDNFNRVLAQLNTLNSEQECKDYIVNQVKPNYDWSNKVEYEERLIALIERKFK